MVSPDAAALAGLAVRLRLATQVQIDECRDEQGKLSGDASVLVRTLERKGYLTPFQSQKLLKGDQDGYFLGTYRLLYRVASGSFGRVFRADDPRTGHVIALKVLRRRWTSDHQKVELFEREAKLGMSLRHPNIVSILSTGKDAPSNQYYIVMEFVEGGNLRDFLSIRKKLAAGEALRVLEEATAGLAHAFSRGVTHRDMKLTNILISATGVAKLVDFGLAGISAGGPAGPSEGDEGDIDRSVDYAGLEKATNVKPGDVRSDIYFLGCVFYELLSGRPPLDMTKDRHIRQAKERFLQVPPLTPEDIEAPVAVFELVSRMMSLDPHRRYQNPAQLLEAVQSAQRAVEAANPLESTDTSRTDVIKAGKTRTVPSPAEEIDEGDDGEPEPSVSGKPIICILERHPQLKQLLHDKLKEVGYEVQLEEDPAAVRQYCRKHLVAAVLMDAAGVGSDAVDEFEGIMAAARKAERACGGILILAEKQAPWAERVTATDHAVVMVRPVTLKELYHKLLELAPRPG